MGMTIAEKILARASGKKDVSAGDFVNAKIDVAWGMGILLYDKLLKEGGYPAGLKKVFDSKKVFLINDHDAPPTTIGMAESILRNKKAAEKYGIKFYDSVGIQHQLLAENGHILPGMLGVGQDSHSVTGGALNAATTGIGPNEMAYAFAFGELWFKVPDTIRFLVKGKLQGGVMAKDIMLYIGAKYGPDVAQYKSIEWGGSVIENTGIDARMSMACQSVELGAKFCLFETDDKTIDYIKVRTDNLFTPAKADPDAIYEKEYMIDGSDLVPYVAFPHSFENGKPIYEAEGVEINQAVVGSCANGRIEDLEIVARIMKGKKVHPRVRFVVQAASQRVLKEASELGIISTILEAGVIVEGSCCGVCTGYRNVLAPGEKCIAATTRNFVGRMGSTEAEIYLANPATVAASALKGEICDPRKVM